MSRNQQPVKSEFDTGERKMFANSIMPVHISGVTKAFFLGAGLGTRLRPLTDRVPKPLVSFFHQPLIRHAWQACRDLGMRDFAINTHHLPGVWKDPILGIGAGSWEINGERAGNRENVEQGCLEGTTVRLFHEPLLLDTGGGLRNVRQWIGDQDVLVHNGDIFSSMNLEVLIGAHLASGLPATLALRSHGVARHIAVDDSHSRVIDIREKLSRATGTHVFSGVYCMNAGVLDCLPDDPVVSVIPAFLQLASQNRLGAVVLDDGQWFDLGERESYLTAHRISNLGPIIHSTARIDPAAVVVSSVIGPDAIVPAGAVVRNSVLWPGTCLTGDADLHRCIVFSGVTVSGRHNDEDF
jgi:mannose-1-phosphate guanylyltransferase